MEIKDFEFVAELDPSTDTPSFVDLSVRDTGFGFTDPYFLTEDVLTQAEYDASKRTTAPIRVWCRRWTDDDDDDGAWALLYDRSMDSPLLLLVGQEPRRSRWPGVGTRGRGFSSSVPGVFRALSSVEPLDPLERRGSMEGPRSPSRRVSRGAVFLGSLPGRPEPGG